MTTAAMASPSPIVRPTGSINMWNTARHSLGIYRCVVNTSTYTVPDNLRTCRSLKTAVQRALAQVVQRHGVLRVGIVDEDTDKPSFVHIRQLDLNQMVHWVEKIGHESDSVDSVDGLLRATEKQHNQVWEDLGNKPGWKLLVHESRRDGIPTSLDISLCFHHAYMDGGSTYIFHQDLLRALNDQEVTADPETPFSATMHFPSPPVLAAATEDLIPFKISVLFLITMLWTEIIRDAVLPSWLRQPTPPDRIPWTGKPINPEPHRANLRCIRISSASLTALLRACRAQRATLTTLLQGLVAASLSARLPPAGEGAALCFQSSCPVALGRFARAPHDHKTELHCLVTGVSHRIEPETVAALRRAQSDGGGGDADADADADADEIIWNIARASTTQLRAKVASLPQDDKVALMTWISNWQQFFVKKFGKKREDTFEVSNLGSMSAGQTGRESSSSSSHPASQRWQIDRAMFSQGANVTGSAFALNVAGVEGEGVWVTVSWQEGIVDTGLMEGVVGDVQRWADEFPERERFY
ncbi:hypothetical protein Micbo1qcDRAFT_233249 [Microdochium bolleyi]|uniref:Alcohol acetyltransferase n=1 Tax=Microdochium bolleyi TaxID=196109 RepID=A0A136J3Y0_9PEZI|nr:hypothetical protein Micbo1qcDRAFT_233249 [Microdochium bolleyi]